MQSMRHSIAVVTLFLWIGIGHTQPIIAQSNGQIEQALQEITDKIQAFHNPLGLSVAIASPRLGVLSAASGLADIEGELPLSTDSMFRIASITKTFVAATILLLTEEGVLTLDDSVEEWLPGVMPNGQNITIRHLLSHTSGIPDYSGQITEQAVENPTQVWEQSEIIQIAADQAPNFEPGERYQYSNTGFFLLGMIVERATEASLSSEIRRRILTPLQLNSTFLAGEETLPPGLAHGHRSQSGGLDDVEDQSYTALETGAWSAGAMVSTAGDLARWSQALYGGQVLEPASLEQMLDLGTAGNGLGIFGTTSALGDGLSHTGGIPGNSSELVHISDENLSVVVLVNQEMNTFSIREDIVREIITLGQLYPQEEDLRILGDDVINGWQLELTDEVEVIADGTPPFEGTIAQSYSVVAPTSFSGRWRLRFIPPAAFFPKGFRAVRFAFRPIELETGVFSNFSIALNGGKDAGNLLKSEGDAVSVDITRQEWQIVEIPIPFFSLGGPVESIDIQGHMEGTFYIDDVRLIASPQPPITAVLEEAFDGAPDTFSLSQNYPNPFNSGTVIRMVLPHTGDLELVVFNMAGQQVATLLKGQRQAGNYTVHWNGRDDRESPLGSGMYLYRLRVGDRVESRKLLLLR